MAKITGLSLDTLRAWERRYQAVVPARSGRGRQYDGQQIERLRLLSQLVQRGHAIGGIATQDDEQLRTLLGTPRATPAGPAPPVSNGILWPVLSAVENFDAASAADELGRLAAILTPRELVYEVSLPLMREVGDRWHDGTFAIAQEHLISQLLRNLLGGMMRSFRPTNPTVKVLLATPAGEPHEFGILCSAMLLSIAGIEPVYLGPDLPAAEIAAAAERVSVRAILLGTTMITDAIADEVRAVAIAMPDTAELWVGGAGSADPALSTDLRRVTAIPSLSALESRCRVWSNL